MLYYDRIDVSKGIDVNKTSESKECNTCHNWYFLHKGFRFQPNVCNGCHDLLMMSIIFSDINNLDIEGFNYHCIISGISRNETINLMQNTDLTGKNEILQNINNLFSYIKMGK